MRPPYPVAAWEAGQLTIEEWWGLVQLRFLTFEDTRGWRALLGA